VDRARLLKLHSLDRNGLIEGGQSLLEYVNIEKTNIMDDADLVKVLDCYWRRESHERVKQKLLNDGYIKPISSGKYMIAYK